MCPFASKLVPNYMVVSTDFLDANKKEEMQINSSILMIAELFIASNCLLCETTVVLKEREM